MTQGTRDKHQFTKLFILIMDKPEMFVSTIAPTVFDRETSGYDSNARDVDELTHAEVGRLTQNHQTSKTLAIKCICKIFIS